MDILARNCGLWLGLGLGLWSQNYLKKEHVFVLKEVMLCCRKCLMGCHVLVECMSSGWHILQYAVFTERHVLLEVMLYLRVCNIRGHVFAV